LLALETLAPQVLFRLLDALALAPRNCLPTLDLEDERLEFDLLALHGDFIGNVRTDGRAVAFDALQQLFALELFH